MLRGFFETCWSKTVGPNVTIFSTFRDYWSEIDSSQFVIGLDDEIVAKAGEDQKDDILDFVGEQLQVSPLTL